MASGSKKKPSIDDLLSEGAPQGPIRRGAGMHLSTVTPIASEVHSSEGAQVQKSEDALVHSGTSAQVQKNESAQVRQSRGYKIRDDLVKECKRIALEEDRKLYQVMEEALEEYIQRKHTKVH
jgi:hypothetical protein